MTRLRLTDTDITTLEVEAIVNAANSRLAGGGGVDGAIHRAGGPSILAECQQWVRRHGDLPTGESMITGGGNLPARVVIHTVGPVWADHDEVTSTRLLASCYRNSLDLAASHECRTIAFPNISTGVYGFPKEPAAETAVEAVTDWVGAVVEEVVFACFDRENYAIYSRLLGS
jgi:O-acetyl-ADP-ribose deacetylase